MRRYQRDDAPALAVAVGESLEHLRPWMPLIVLEPTTLEEREELLKRWDRDWAEGTQYSYGMSEGPVSSAEQALCDGSARTRSISATGCIRPLSVVGLRPVRRER